MLTNLIFPVQDLDSADFHYDGDISNKDYERMELEHINSTYGKVGDYLEGRYYNPYGYDIQEEREYDDIDNDMEVEVETLILTTDRKDFEEEEFFKHIESGKKFLMIVNMNPTTIDPDAESEIRYWLEDSMRVWNDNDLDQRTKILSSPERDLKIVLSDGVKYTLQKCKIFEDYSDEKYPLYFAVFVDKITKE